MSQENNSERDRCTTARMRSQWSACWAEKREVLERDAFQDLFERITNNPSQEQHPAEPHAELNDQQQNVLQSGPEFGQTGPHNQTQPEFNNVPSGKLTKHLEVRLAPVGLFKGKVIYGAPGDRVPSPVNNRHSQKRKRESQQDDDMPYVKLSKTEQTLNAVAELKTPDCATDDPSFEKRVLLYRDCDGGTFPHHCAAVCCVAGKSCNKTPHNPPGRRLWSVEATVVWSCISQIAVSCHIFQQCASSEADQTPGGEAGSCWIITQEALEEMAADAVAAVQTQEALEEMAADAVAAVQTQEALEEMAAAAAVETQGAQEKMAMELNAARNSSLSALLFSTMDYPMHLVEVNFLLQNSVKIKKKD
ncbi:uncharacterized protein [Paralichthys olivaceus]|uniref:uncharacterized protein isoform X2 n=1 Tax=Paralichthys olivaceus TaxID=8255 RepID=UPI00375194CE